MLLKYLFHCQFNDGEIFSQNADDRSLTDPKKSSFFDLLQDTRKVEKFWLTDEHNFNTYLVDLTDGHFEVNGCPFFLHEQSINVKLAKFRLIYFRRRTAHLNVVTKEQSESPIIFVVGWQANHPDGRNEQQLLYIK